LRSGTEAVPLHYAFSVALQEAKEIQEKEVWRLQLLSDFFIQELKRVLPSVVFYGIFDEIKTGHDTRNEVKVGEAQEMLLPRNDAMEEHVGVRIMKRLPNNINCRIPGISSEEMILRLDAKGFAVSHKSACASRESDGSYVIESLGATSEEALENIRISMGRFTKKKDMERLVEAMKYIADTYASK
jgi:cysteine sulfinate desulfinase/cysteine desulfurase-like protein